MAKAKKISKIHVPFVRNQAGDLVMMEYVSSHRGYPTVSTGVYGQPGYVYGAPSEWRYNDPFDATLEPTGHWRGRSSARVGVRDVNTGTRYSMGFASFYDAVVDGRAMAKGLMKGRWQVRKQGANYILVAVDVA